jgi:hypothetical protein
MNSEEIKQAANVRKEVEKLISNMFCPGQRAGVAVVYSLPPDYTKVYYSTNLSRDSGINILKATTEKLISETN